MGNGNLLVAYISEQVGSGTSDECFVRGQQFDFDGKRIGQEILFQFPDETDTENFDIIARQDNKVAILADQDRGIETDTPFVGVFTVKESGRAYLQSGESESVSGTGVRHFDFALTKRGADGWMTHSVGRRGVSFLFSRDKLRQASDEDGAAVIAGLGGSDDDLQSTTLTNGEIVLLHDREGDRDAEGRLEAQIVSQAGVTRRSIFLGQQSAKNYDGAIQSLQRGGFVVAYTEADARDKDVVFHLFKSNGTVVRPNVSVASLGINENNNEPAIAPLADGGFIIIYDKDTSPSQVRGQRYDSKGIPVGEDFLVAHESGL